MAFERFYDRLMQVSLDGGTGDLALGVAVNSYFRFGQFVQDGEQQYICIEDENNNLCEVSLCTYFASPAPHGRIQRDSVLVSSNNGAKVDFPLSYVKRVFSVAPALAVNWLHSHQAEQFTLSTTDVANKFVTLTYKPLAGSVHLDVHNAPLLAIGTAYVVDAQAQRISWNGTILDGKLRAGDKLVARYARFLA